jgi:hypothetical protein
MTNKPTSSEPDEPFRAWLDAEVNVAVEALKARGMTPAQAGYVLTVALGAVITLESKDPKDSDKRLEMPLIHIGHNLRPQAMQHWNQAQIVN